MKSTISFALIKAEQVIEEVRAIAWIKLCATLPMFSLFGARKPECVARYVAKEYGARGIRANTVAPGGIVTDFNNAAIRSNPKAQEWIVAQTPMGRLGEAHDIGGVVALLCSDETRWLTGQRLEVTGGFNL